MTEVTILLVEDDAILAMHLEDLLTRQGYTVLEPAATGEEAIQILKKQKPSLVLMDIELGGEMNGITAAEQIGAFTDTPVFFLTGFSQDPLLQQAKIAAPYGYLVKPVPERELAATIEMALYRFKLDHQVRESEARYHALIEQASDGIFLSDPQGNYIEVNSAGCRMLGYTRDEMLTLNMRDLIPCEDVAEAPLRLPEMLLGAAVLSERRLRRKDGTCFQVEISGKMLQDGNLQGIVRDITERKQADKALKESEERFRLLFQSMESGFALHEIICDARGVPCDYRFLEINPAFEKLTGLKAVSLIGHTTLEIMPGTEKEWIECYGKVALTGEVAHFENYSQELGKYYQVTAYSPKPMQFAVLFRDITERKKIEMELEESERCAHATVNALSAHLTILDDDGTIIAVNHAWQAFARSNGAKDPHFFVGVNYLKLCDYSQGIHSEGAAEFAQGIRSVMSGKCEQFTLEYPCNSPSENRWFLGKVTRFPGEGRLRLVISHEDITGPKQAEEAIRESEERLRLAQGAANAGAWEWNLLTNKNAWSEKLWHLYGLEPDSCEPSFETWLQSVHPDDRARVERAVTEAASSKTDLNAEWRVFLPDGEKRWLMSRGKPMRDANGQVTRYIGVVIDITERKQMEEALLEEKALLAQKVEDRTTDLLLANKELLRSARMKDEFLASMSHELRTPLTGILGLSGALQTNIYGELNQKQIDSIQSIEKSGQHLLTLINDILDLSKIGAGMIELELKPVSIRSVCASSIQMIRQISHEKQIKANLHIEEGLDYLEADERRLKQILVNLLSNAVKFTPEGSEFGLEVRGDIPNKRITFTVWDHGIGIPDQDLSRLFQPFTQLDGALSRQYAGTGLGLSLVLKMVELHGGGVAVESEPGQGSRFSVTLPWHGNHHQETHEIIPQTTNLQEPKTKIINPLVLIVEDNLLYLNLLRDILIHSGYRVATAQNGEEGITQAREKKPHLILMDIQMPILDGFQAARRIRMDAELEKVPIIALTALAMSGDREKCVDAGMNGYLSKPVNIEELKKVMLTLIYQNTAIDGNGG